MPNKNANHVDLFILFRILVTRPLLRFPHETVKTLKHASWNSETSSRIAFTNLLVSNCHCDERNITIRRFSSLNRSFSLSSRRSCCDVLALVILLNNFLKIKGPYQAPSGVPRTNVFASKLVIQFRLLSETRIFSADNEARGKSAGNLCLRRELLSFFNSPVLRRLLL